MNILQRVKDQCISRIAKSVTSYSSQNHIGSLKPIADSFYFDHENYWEPNVVLACRDVLKPGDTFWDIGANMGGITRLASRLVGPKGVVIAVEASLTNFRKLSNNVVVNHLNNVFLIRGAAWSSADQSLTLFNGDGGNDSLFASDRLLTNSEKVLALTLDDLSVLYGVPNLIKLDIEGSEYEALLGAEKITESSINFERPVIILESSNEDVRALKLLSERGFVLQDLATGQIWENFLAKHPDPISNWLAVPSERLSEKPGLLEPFAEVPHSFEKINHNFVSGFLQKGRYRVDIDIEPLTGENIYLNIYNDDTLISRYHGDAKWLQDSYRSRQIDFCVDGNLIIKIEDPSGNTNPVSTMVKVHLMAKVGFEINMMSHLLAP
jgi:FkbM family methyltransferase